MVPIEPELTRLITDISQRLTMAAAWPTPTSADGQAELDWLADVAALRTQHDAVALEATRLCPALPAPRTPRDLHVEYVSVPVGPDRVQSARLYRPRAERADRPAVLLLHGGGWWMAGGAVALSPKATLVVSPHRTTDVFVNFGRGLHSNDVRGAVLGKDPVTPLTAALGYEFGVRTRLIDRLELDQGLQPILVLTLSLLVFELPGAAGESSRPRVERALSEVLSRIDGVAHPKTLRVRNSLAVLFLEAKRYADAERVLKAALPDYEKTYGPDHSATLGLIGNLGGALRQGGKVAESGAYYRRAAEGFSAKLGDQHPRAIMTRHNYGNYQLDAGDAEASLETQRTVYARAVQTFGNEHPVVAEILEGWGKAATALGHWDEAQARLDESLAMKTRIYGADHHALDATKEARAELEKARAAK